VIWPYTSYTEIQTPWQPITEKFMGRKVSHEFMRRFPLMVPRWLYPRLREFCYQQHGMPVADYIRLQPARAFSEFNALGAYAYQCHHNDFIWLNTLEQPLEDSYARQFHSWGGITEEVKAELERILRGTKESSPTIQSGEKADPTVLEGGPGANFVSSQIKVLPNGVWVLRGDQISQWIEEEGRLDHDQNFLPKILAHINPGDNVVDVGAFVGDHTIAYARAVGKSGRVYAFEPNPMALECLSHNLFADSQENNRVIIHAVALGEEAGSVPLSGNNGNWGGAYVGEHMKIGQVACRKLDDYNLSPDLIKIDAEGYELKVLRGAERTIEAHRPKLVIEMNVEALRRQGTSYEDILFWLRDHQYSWVVMQENCTLNSPMYDIFCSYNQISPEVPLTSDKGEGGLTRCASSPPPVTSPPLTPYGEMIAAVLLLKKFADVDSNHRMRVMQHLSKNGLTPRWPKRKKKRK
jgi:FkbM family methyltransferase